MESAFIKVYGVLTIPRFILIDPNGIIVDANAARPSDFALKQQLDLLLQQAKSSKELQHSLFVNHHSPFKVSFTCVHA